MLPSGAHTVNRPLKPRRRRGGLFRPGISNIWFALLGLFLIGMVGLAIDAGYGYLTAHQLQNAADAAALAGALKVRMGATEARAAAISVAVANRAAGAGVILRDNPDNTEDGDVVIGRYNRSLATFTATLTEANAVKVVARKTEDSPNGRLDLFFGSVFGVHDVEITRTAIAVVGGATGAGILVLDRTERNALTVQGDVTVNTGEGAIQVNSSAQPSAAFVNGNPVLNTPALNVTGGARLVGDVILNGELNTGKRIIPDPLAWLPPPSYDPAADLGAVNITGGGEMRIGPGYYSGGIAINNGSLTLDPGIYIVDGAGLNISGNATFLAEGVMFYVVGSGKVDLTGTGDIRITPPDPDVHDYDGAELYEYITFFQARDNLSEARIIGTSLLDLEGTLYFSGNNVKISGTGDGFGNQLIAGTMEIEGTGELMIRYDGKEPAPGNRVYLVE